MGTYSNGERAAGGPGIFSLEGKVALVTGGSRGLGRGIALALARAGADVAVASRNARALEGVAREIRGLGRRGIAVTADVAQVKEVRKMVAEALSAFGRLDILVDAAGVNQRTPSLEVTEALWHFIVDINLKGTFFACQAAAEAMREGGGGSIINIASLLSGVGIPTLAPYAASKAGVVGLTRVLAAEWGPHGIRVNCIAPGYFRTDMTRALFEDPDWYARLRRQVPLGREGFPEDLAGVAVFLASDASAYLTGQVIYVDGGFISSRES
ncbi:TPA: glucose 1-dehydrogenase [Candidatus Bipolaricaulota bacterium]|nr:glucose 1-dehydrogenase [Anaerolineae bacterium]HIP98981.1 glucose 1-dehydrogenase [Candidatus Bipolaricaulota bacterium]